MKRIYIAAPLAFAEAADAMASQLLQAAGPYSVVSRWHSCVLADAIRVDPEDAALRTDILADNLIDIRACDVVVALLHAGRPRAALCEVGYALALGKPIVWTHAADSHGRNLFDAHRGVVRVERREATFAADVIAALREIA